MAASDLEFRYRFWIFGALFCIAFASYSIDHRNTGDVIVQWIARVRGMTARAGNYRAIFAVGSGFLRRSGPCPYLGHCLSEA
jgi:hypothetical protein